MVRRSCQTAERASTSGPHEQGEQQPRPATGRNQPGARVAPGHAATFTHRLAPNTGVAAEHRRAPRSGRATFSPSVEASVLEPERPQAVVGDERGQHAGTSVPEARCALPSQGGGRDRQLAVERPVRRALGTAPARRSRCVTHDLHLDHRVEAERGGAVRRRVVHAAEHTDETATAATDGERGQAGRPMLLGCRVMGQESPTARDGPHSRSAVRTTYKVRAVKPSSSRLAEVRLETRCRGLTSECRRRTSAKLRLGRPPPAGGNPQATPGRRRYDRRMSELKIALVRAGEREDRRSRRAPRPGSCSPTTPTSSRRGSTASCKDLSYELADGDEVEGVAIDSARRARHPAALDRARDGPGGPGPVPGRQARHRAADRERLLLRLRRRDPVRPRGPREDRDPDAQDHQGGAALLPAGHHRRRRARRARRTSPTRSS